MTGPQAPEDVQDPSASTLRAESDPLVGNGLGSPLCSGTLGAAELSPSGRAHCETSGFLAAAAPTGDFGIDVHIDTGLLGLGSGQLLNIVQDLLITPLWMAMVWAVHALFVALEWSFTLDLLDSAAAGGLGAALRQMQAALTVPWLALVLAIAAVLALYNGIVRRRVSETAGQAALMTTMMAAGMWVILDPAGTVGALARWANEASLGTLAIAATGGAAAPGRALGERLESVYGDVVEAPWCYLEFGDVSWCRDPARLDSRLHAAGQRIAAAELARIGCDARALSAPQCVAGGGSRARALERSARLLREAETNAGVFLALPANGPDRNSINDEGSLLRTLCQSSEATNCGGPDAAQAEFRTNGGTWPRFGGLLLIGAGLLGLVLLLGFISLRLLAAALLSIFLLLLAPGVVLAPALGEAGRGLFRRWALELLGAVVAKLLFAFLLGAVLAVGAILSRLATLGWWTQWLLMSAFWWGAFVRRHQALALVEGQPANDRPRRALARRVGAAVEPPLRLVRAGKELRERQLRSSRDTAITRRPPDEGQAQGGGAGGRPSPGGPAGRQPPRGRRGSSRSHARRPTTRSKADTAPGGGLAAWIERLRNEQARAAAAKERRRELKLGDRARRLEAELVGVSQRPRTAGAAEDSRARGAVVGDHVRGRSTAGGSHEPVRPAEPVRHAARPDARRAPELEQELAPAPIGGRRGQPDASEAPPPDPLGGHRDPAAVDADEPAPPRAGSPPARGPVRPRRPAEEESPVMRDAREVEAGRKRQLGYDRD